MSGIDFITSRSVALPIANIDTDQIIPARFLTTTSRAGLGRHAFQDWRWREGGSANPEFALNRPENAGAGILIAGDNFGCGSSREHAPWALLDAGIRAVISTAIADIFRSNALKNGLLAIVVSPAEHASLLAAAGETLTIDLRAQRIGRIGQAPIDFTINAFARQCLLDGVDELGYLLARTDAIARFEGMRA
ncbi:MAG: 3-isopropylmalate dehydratase small subunit [Xanthomonadales bacterium]|jgi:3-isopropylmalate/(R)-2-methylmalate dehydratase small subunit|nr:3-isopropylmalate dehydratase small subunit [Xanthomonadales bacterium]MBP6077843.1 3-isopropylmalate dehydratase small subunit [Xanthomonadales bacterium]